MRYHYEPKTLYCSMYGVTYECRHPVYTRCTLYLEGERGMAVIQQRYNPADKTTWWTEIDPWLTDDLYLQAGFLQYFNKFAGNAKDGLYPTVTIRQIMWALKMKPLKREPWETVFDKSPI